MHEGTLLSAKEGIESRINAREFIQQGPPDSTNAGRRSENDLQSFNAETDLRTVGYDQACRERAEGRLQLMKRLAQRASRLLPFASAPEQSNELRPQNRPGGGECEKCKQSAGLADLGKHGVAVCVDRQHRTAQVHPQQRRRYNRVGLPREPIFGCERDDGAPLGFVARTLNTTNICQFVKAPKHQQILCLPVLGHRDSVCISKHSPERHHT
jgi:hypothetical protein